MTHEDEFEETLENDEADTLFREARMTLAESPQISAMAQAWMAGRRKTAARSSRRQTSHTIGKIATAEHRGARERSRISKLKSSIILAEREIAQILTRRKEYENQLADLDKHIRSLTTAPSLGSRSEFEETLAADEADTLAQMRMSRSYYRPPPPPAPVYDYAAEAAAAAEQQRLNIELAKMELEAAAERKRLEAEIAAENRRLAAEIAKMEAEAETERKRVEAEAAAERRRMEEAAAVARRRVAIEITEMERRLAIERKQAAHEAAMAKKREREARKREASEMAELEQKVQSAMGKMKHIKSKIAAGWKQEFAKRTQIEKTKERINQLECNIQSIDQRITHLRQRI